MREFYKLEAPRIYGFFKCIEDRQFLLGLRRVTRYTAYKVLKYAPTPIYDKLFSKSYLPFATRYNLPILFTAWLGWKVYRNVAYDSSDCSCKAKA
ncbi:unnamed protein product [Blepharisma stoltei]|uniref:Ubiquinol-cytochrome c reductase complex ubiquinone-binding protein QP-C n=1 Tax=Blepharisma stoltei TaxID=1481888 RepID=A0AAU9J4L3_9CILI|nr:unnamed protein product [Blepharisma stoltei]